MPRSLFILAAALAASGAGMAARPTAGSITLPTEWRLPAAPGDVAMTKTFPESAVRTADGRLIVVEAGAGTPGIRILDASTLAFRRDIAAHNVYGVPLADRNGSAFGSGLPPTMH